MVEQCKLIIYFVDSDGLFTGIVLYTTSDKSLREEESTHPKDLRSPKFNPISQEFDPKSEVLDPTAQRFQILEANTSPYLSNLIIINTVAKLL